MNQNSPNSRPTPVRAALATTPLSIPNIVRTARRNLLEIIPELATRQPMVSGRTIKRWHMVMDPVGVKRILRERPDAYPKSEHVKNILRPGIGESLFIAEGPHWLWQRRAAAPVFASRNVRELAPIMSAAAKNTVDRVAAASGRLIDMHAEMVASTFEVISKVTFSGSSMIDGDVVHRAIESYIDQTARVSFLDVIGAPSWIPRFGRLVRTDSIREMREVADNAIALRMAEPDSARIDLLGLLSGGEDPKSGRKMNANELRDNLLTFIVAGHETTALALSWSLYLIAFDPAVQEQARIEAKAVLNGRLAGAADVDALVLTRRVIEESLRLYPPAGLLARVAREPDEIGGRTIKPGDMILLPIYALQRNVCHWDDPDQFNPDRFAEPQTVDKFAYIPFGGGPRICIGASFAMMEATIVLASLISRFRFVPVAGREPEPVMILTLRPQGGVWLRAEPV